MKRIYRSFMPKAWAKKVKKANRESLTGIEPMTYPIPDARSELQRESWCYVKHVLYSAKMLKIDIVEWTYFVVKDGKRRWQILSSRANSFLIRNYNTSRGR